MTGVNNLYRVTLQKYFIYITGLFLLTAAVPVSAVAAAPVRGQPAAPFARNGSQVEPIRLVINGQTVASDVAPVIVNGRTLVPARVIAETLGAHVDWDARTRRVTVTMGDTEVVLTVDSKKARIGGKPATLDVPALVLKGRTMVPLRFISEALGAEVGWDSQARIATVNRFFRLTDIRFEPDRGKGRLILTADGPVAYQVRATGEVPGTEPGAAPGAGAGSVSRAAVVPVAMLGAESPERPRIVLDLPNTRLPDSFEPLVVGQGSVRLVRAEALEGPPPTARVVVDLARPVVWEVVYGENPDQVVVEVRYQLTDVEYRDGEGLLLHLTGPADPAVRMLTDPDQMILELPGFTPGDNLAAIMRPGGAVREVRVEAPPGAGVRVVADLAGPAGYRLEPHPEGLLVRLLPQVRSVRWDESGENLRLTVETSLPARFTALRGERPGALAVVVAGAVLALPDGRAPAPSGKVTAVEAVAGEDPVEVRLGFTIRDLVDFRVVEGAPANSLVLEVVAGALSGKLVVVDPGHGGSDPGAIGPGGTQEKDVNLAVARRLRALLEAAGARVLMTREDDRFVGLYDRANLADGAGADLFVSIHCNSMERRGVRGTETYHYPGSVPGRRLAELLHSRLLAALNRPDRGVQGANFVVVREPDMPSALVELAYLSNPEEERLLLSSDFQNAAAGAIRQGVIDFFREQGNAAVDR